MKRFLLWLGITIAIFFILIFGAYLFISSLFDTEPYVAQNSYLTIPLSGSLPEYLPSDVIQEQFSGTAMDMKKLRQSLKMAAVDERIKGVVLKVGFVQTGFAKIQEIRQLIFKFRQSNKKILAYLDIAFMRDYYIASACDSVFLQPEGTLMLTGMSAEVSFYKDLLGKLGIVADFEHVGKYKSYPEAYTRQKMSAEQKEVIDQILDNRFDEWISTVSEDREISKDNMTDLVNDVSVFVPEEALEYRLIDGVKHYEELSQGLQDTSVSLYAVSALDYSGIDPQSLGLENGSKIAVITCAGSIMVGEDGADPVFGRTMGANRVVRNLNQVADNKSIKAIILRIDSPGGSGLASEKVWFAVKQAAQKKPVIASISDMGASGGYYIAIAADTIIAQNASLIGSIGVFVGKFDLSGLYDKIGINTESLQRGRNARILSLKNGFSNSERLLVRKIIEDYYQNFVEKVAEARGKSFDEIHLISQGRVWNGQDGIVNGLVDRIGGLDDAITVAKTMAGLEPDMDVRLIYYPKAVSFMNSIRRNVGFIYDPLTATENYFRKIQVQSMALLPFILNYN